MPRILACTLVLALAAGPCLDAQYRTKSTTSNKPPTTNQPPSNNQPPSRHPPDKRTGTPPCGYYDANVKCVPPDTTRPHDNTARNVGIGVGLGLLTGLVIAGIAHHSAAGVKLSDNGPQFPDMLHESTFHVTGFVHGGWPLVVDYEPTAGSYLVLTVATPGIQPFTQVLSTQTRARYLQILNIPTEFGADLRIADFSLQSTRSQSDPTLTYLRVYGIGCGPRAVGSVAIDQLHFGPQSISGSSPQTQLSFHSHTKFDNVRSEFMQVALVDNCMEGQKVDDKSINRNVNAEDSVQDTWNAKKAHPGQIQFRVRGWMTKENKGDWVSAFSPDLVFKQ